MKYAQVILVGVLLLAASPALAQYGLYGSPEMLPMQSMSPTAPQYAYPSTPVNPSYPSAGAYFSAAAAQPFSTPRPYVPSRPYAASPQYAYTGQQASPSDAGPVPAPGYERIPTPRLEPVGPGGPSVVDQMIDDSPDLGYDLDYGCDFGCGEGCGEGCATGCCPSWYGRAGWIMVGGRVRDKPNTVWTTYVTGNNAQQLSSTSNYSSWGGSRGSWNGMEVGHGGPLLTLGHCFSCGRWGLEGTYWGLSPMTGIASMTHPDTVSTALAFDDVVYADPSVSGLPVDLFDGADEHRLRRYNEYHNVEMNLVHCPFQCGRGCMRRCGCGPLDVNWMFGFRYFRFKEAWSFHSLRMGGSWSNPANVGCLDDMLTNDLIGCQLGFNMRYCCTSTLSLFLRPKVGIYNNHIEHSFRAYRADGELFAPSPGSGITGRFPVNSSTNALSFLTEIELGLNWQFACHWGLEIGYRVVAATGIALAEHQIVPYVVDIPEIASIDRNGQLVMHGAFAGLTFNF